MAEDEALDSLHRAAEPQRLLQQRIPCKEYRIQGFTLLAILGFLHGPSGFHLSTEAEQQISPRGSRVEGAVGRNNPSDVV